MRIMKIIFEKRDNLNLELEDEAFETPLYTAIKEQATDIAEMLIIEKGVKIYEAGKSNTSYPLARAAYSGNIKIVNLLLERGAKILPCSLSIGYYDDKSSDLKIRTMKDASPIFGAIVNRVDEELVRILIEAGDNPRRVLADNTNLIYWAVYIKSFED